MTIANIRGTHGSGKSYIVHQILKRYPHEEVWTETHETPEDEALLGGPARQKLLGYKVTIPGRKKLFVVGPYRTQCGGADAIQPYDLIWPRVERFAELGHVLFEGALVSSCMGSVVKAMALRKDCIVAFLDTPLEICLNRIRARREAKGDLRPLNPHNTEVKFQGILRSRSKIEALGLRCVDLNYKRAYTQILELL